MANLIAAAEVKDNLAHACLDGKLALSISTQWSRALSSKVGSGDLARLLNYMHSGLN